MGQRPDDLGSRRRSRCCRHAVRCHPAMNDLVQRTCLQSLSISWVQRGSTSRSSSPRLTATFVCYTPLNAESSSEKYCWGPKPQEVEGEGGGQGRGGGGRARGGGGDYTHKARLSIYTRVEELCESRGGRPELSVLTSLMVSVDVKQH